MGRSSSRPGVQLRFVGDSETIQTSHPSTKTGPNTQRIAMRSVLTDTSASLNREQLVPKLERVRTKAEKCGSQRVQDVYV